MKLSTIRVRSLWLLTALLLLSAFLRLQHLVSFVEWPDEIRSVWHVEGTFSEAMSRVPRDWPPLFSAILWLWQQMVGTGLEAARFLSALLSLLGAAFFYRAGRLLVDAPYRHNSGLISALAYSVMAYSIFAGVDVRAYGMLLMLGALAFWLGLRWLKTPSLWRSIILALILAAMIWSSYTSFAFIGCLTMFVLVMQPSYFVRWVIVGALTLVLVITLIPSFLANAANRFEVMPQPMPPFPDAIVRLYNDFGGSIWFAVLVTAALVLAGIWSLQFLQERRRIMLIAGWALLPMVVYFTITNHEFWKPRYMWWVLPGLAFLFAYAAHLPQIARRSAVIMLLVLPLMSVDWYTYRHAPVTSPPFRAAFSWLAMRLRPDDVIVIDPNCTCGESYGWDYFVPQYFPTGYLPIVEHPGNASRVWYLSTDGWPHDDQLFAEVTNGRRPSIFVGPWNFLLRLYEGPPLWEGISFGDSIHLNGVEIAGNETVFQEDQQINVKLWWSTEQPLDVDYSISVALLNPQGQPVIQADGPVTSPEGIQETSSWQVGIYYEDYRSLYLPADFPLGRYRLVVTVYQWWDNVRLSPEESDLFAGITLDNYLVVRAIEVTS
jgi:hypothetical protein